MEGWLADGAGLRDRVAMLETLRSRNTRVILHGRDDPQPALTSLGSVKLEPFGPPKYGRPSQRVEISGSSNSRSR